MAPVCQSGSMGRGYIWFNCSVGYQKESFETVFGRPVKARLLTSKVSGSRHRVFEVTPC